MNPKDVKDLIEYITGTNVKMDQTERLLFDLAKRAVRQDRWLSSKDAWMLQALYRKSQGSRI